MSYEALALIYNVLLFQEETTTVAQEQSASPGVNLGSVLLVMITALSTGFVTHRLTLRRERNKEASDEIKRAELEHREKIGLLKLVHIEVTNNLEYLKKMEDPELGEFSYKGTAAPDRQNATALKSLAWERSSNRLAELVEDEEHFEFLVSCYGSLAILKDRLTNPNLEDEFTVEEHSAQIKSVTRHHWLAFNVCQKETGLFRYWSNGMLVSQPVSELENETKQDEEEG